MTRRGPGANPGTHPIPSTKINPDSKPRHRTWCGSAYGLAALESEIAGVRGTQSLFKAACVAGELIAGDELDEDFAFAELLTAWTTSSPGLRRQIIRGIARGKRRPRRVENLQGTHITTQGEARQGVIGWWAAVDATGTDLRILHAIAGHAYKVGTTTIRLSYRELAELAGVSVSTIANHADELRRWVRIVRKGRRHVGNDSRTTWRLVLRRGAETNRPKAYLSSGEEDCSNLPNCDLWHRWASGWILWSALDPNESATPRELVGATGYSRRTVARNLARLEALDLANSDEGRWLRLERDVDWQDFFHRAERKDRHHRDRDRHRAYLKARFDLEVSQ